MALAVALVATAEAALQCSNSVTELQISGTSIFYTSTQVSVISRYLGHKRKPLCYPEFTSNNFL